MTATKIFEIGQTYTTYETGTVVKVLSRSMSSLTILINGEPLQKRFKLNDGVETIQISKWETVYADDVVCDEDATELQIDNAVVCDEDFQFTITALESVLFTVTVNSSDHISHIEYGDEHRCAAFIGQHNISDDNDLSVFDGYLESALKIKDSEGLMLSIDRRYGNGGRIARVELVQSLIGREVVFQKKQHATVIEEFKATDESELEYGEDWITIKLESGKRVSLSKDAKTLDWIN
jgi:hypothetical protein